MEPQLNATVEIKTAAKLRPHIKDQCDLPCYVYNRLLPTVSPAGSRGLGLCEEYHQLNTAHWPGTDVTLIAQGPYCLPS